MFLFTFMITINLKTNELYEIVFYSILSTICNKHGLGGSCCNIHKQSEVGVNKVVSIFKQI